MWTQVETGSAITWKYPSCVLKGENSSGEFYSIAITNNMQQADTGTKMIHTSVKTQTAELCPRELVLERLKIPTEDWSKLEVDHKTQEILPNAIAC